MRMTTLLLPFLLALQLDASQPRCAELGNFEPGTARPWSSLLGISTLFHNGEVVVLTGFLREGLGDDFLCTTRRATLKEFSVAECYRLTYNWEAFAAEEAEVRRVLRQWRGGRVEVSGRLEVAQLSPARLIGKEPPGGLGNVSWVRNLEQGAQEPYCLGYTGPTRASPWERELGPVSNGESRCLDTAAVLLLPMPLHVCVDPIEPVVWIPSGEQATGTKFGDVVRHKYRAVPFVPPAPYATRDLQYFAPLRQDLFLFTLPDDNLYLWEGSESRKLVDKEVDQVQGDGRGSALYRATRRDSEGDVSWNALIWINTDLETEVLWQSDQARLERFYWRTASPQLEIVVREGGSLQLYRPSTNGWTLVPSKIGSPQR